jgi:hypothetical protein
MVSVAIGTGLSLQDFGRSVVGVEDGLTAGEDVGVVREEHAWATLMRMEVGGAQIFFHMS